MCQTDDELRWVSVVLTPGDDAPTFDSSAAIGTTGTVDATGAQKTVFEYKFSDEVSPLLQ